MINVWEHYPAQNAETYVAIPLPIVENVTETLYCPFCRDLWIQYTIAGMASGESITGVVEGSLDGENWDNIDADDLEYEITSDGTTLFTFPGSVPPYIRARGISAVYDDDTVITTSILAYFGVMV